MQTLKFKIEDKKNLVLTVIRFENVLSIYIVEDKTGIRGSSRINWKKALYNYNRNAKRKMKNQ